ncbi:Branched-chain alpha-keto acid dehydrogenase, E1 component, alpha subunit [Fulvivirga imtechensis AK7]|uniref:Branched-chain alpha-keto acid dehydrogenase, E1 component, alpha subunit n=1 Tax=Fulvivirga imtechensis AK7 TaxID=1237149 RepID=L8JPY0_9BACT|nr:alpha-ketoacid dehydrogenase subunit alpha/beta [Fulvivirga imtechensis]ELR69564.1 Branched-chain alpha-keto acid dehydrogenase, E1 component, alpha subunit [Fulvivirga imtechensis AK7]
MSTTKTIGKTSKNVSEILQDYKLACESREASLLGRKEVFMGKAKFGIFGDGKELAQIAMAKAFKPGDFRSGYYRDQTFMFAIGELNMQEYFAQLYAHTDVEADPASAGRLMNGHFATRMLDESGELKELCKERNSSSDISPTAAQMPRLVGLAYASKLFRQNNGLKDFKNLSVHGNEVAFGTIGNASTSEGMFYEAINAAGVLQIPMLMSVWDDDYGISVPKEYHTTKGSISEVLAGFQRNGKNAGFEIFTVKGWDYENLLKTYQKAARVSREEHVPTLVHVLEMTQPQGHSTSGSHERYKSRERLEWEKEYDCIVKFREWILENGWVEPEELDNIEEQAKQSAKEAKNAAWKAFMASIKDDEKMALDLLDQAIEQSQNAAALRSVKTNLESTLNSIRLDSIKAVKRALRLIKAEDIPVRKQLQQWVKRVEAENLERFSSHLYSESALSALKVEEIKARFDEEAKVVDGREVLQACFDAALARDPRVFAFGEDVGKIGDVNQAFAGLQEKYGELRVTDTGIRECTIVGQGIGAALRGLRPIAEIQYLDYLLYAIQILSDDLATLQYRTRGGQKAPLIIRTRGHRLEGVWHSGSPMGMILNSIRGIYVLVPRNMTQAAGFYNTMLKSDDAALIIECLNGYRLKERIPQNIGEFTVPLGKPEILRSGTDVTIVTYGSMCRVVMEAAEQLNEEGISCEVIDVQTLLPFDIDHTIVESLKKTNRVVFADEDVPGGASAFMMQKVLEEQNGYKCLDSKPITITGKEHRPAYASDGDYFSKPNTEEVFDKVYALMAEANPDKYPDIY